MTERLPYLTTRLQGFGTTIFAEMSALAVATGAINLGQGFPDTDGPPEVLDAAVAAIRAGDNQYPPGIGVPELRAAIAAHQRHWYGLEYDADTEVLVTTGATEAIAASLLALCEPGDEVVTFEPYYDSYAACIAMAGAERRVVQLRTPDYSFDPAALAAAITPRTRLLLLNSPHNPTGKVFSRSELELIARSCVEHDLVAVTDEVYEHLVFEGEHLPLASLPGIRDRTVTISSGGKTFSCTGWKVGWICASPELVAAVRTAKQFLTYVNSAPYQRGVAVGLGLPDDRINALGVELRENRDRLSEALHTAGFGLLPCAGTYFVTADIRLLGEHDGLAFCRALPARCGVVAIPNVVFYDDKVAGLPLVRFACCKRLEVIEEAATRLKGLGAHVKVAAIQHDVVWEDAPATFELVAPLLAHAAAEGARLAVLTEMYATGFSMDTDRIAEPVDGPSASFLVEQAARHDMWVCGTVPERGASGELPANTLVLAAPSGDVHRYRKIHPFSYSGEHEHYRAGDTFVTVDVDGIRCSLFVCYDLRFADEFWAVAPGTDLYVVPANWPAKRRDHWRTLLRARAIENQAYVVGVNRVGEGGGLEYVGDSAIIGPFGEELVDGAEVGEAVLVAEVDAAHVADVRARFPFLADRR